LTQTAASGLLHHDYWLEDWITSNHSAHSIEGDQRLAAALEAGSAGEAESSLAAAQQATELYRSSGQRPGLLRAQLAQIYALQRLGRGKECVDAAAQLEHTQALNRYPRIEGQALLDKGICESRAGDVTGSEASLAQAMSIATRFALPLLQINVTAMQASALDFRGMSAEAWQVDSSGLRLCEQVQCPPAREYKFLYDMVSNAQSLDLPYAAAALMGTAERLADASPDAATRAYALETLGLVAGRSGDYQTSSKAFETAEQSAHSGNQAALARIYQAEWQVDRAEILSRQGKPRAALNLLQQSVPVVIQSDYQPVRVSFYTQLSIAQLSLGRYNEALAAADSAVQEAERPLGLLHSDAERQQWMRENATIYAELVKVFLHRGEDTLALKAWERFRSIAFSNAVAPLASSSAAAPVGARVLVLARIDGNYVGWLAQAQPLEALRTVVLGDRAHLELSAHIFYRLCADPNSDLVSLKDLGQRLYASLLGPFSVDFATSPHVWIDLDPSLGMLPMAALRLPNGTWLGDNDQINILPAWWSLDPATAVNEAEIRPTMRIAIVSGFDRTYAGLSEAADVAQLFTHSTIIDGTRATSQAVLSALGSTDIFHFSGHATAGAGGRLLLASGNSESNSVLRPQSLEGVRLHGCRLAVLAACNTSAEDPDQIEKVPGLRNAFLLSGVHNVVSSNWDVDDHSTRSLMLTFYKQLVLGLTPSRALQVAQQNIHSTSGWEHPYYWAAFAVFSH
jgi:CHAT domain-containing protein